MALFNLVKNPLISMLPILPRWYLTPSSALYAYSDFKFGLGTITRPGDVSNSLPISSILGILYPVEKLALNCNQGFARYTHPRLAVSAASLILAVRNGKVIKLVSKLAESLLLLNLKPWIIVNLLPVFLL